MAGLSDSGFEIKRLADIKTEIEDALKTSFGNAINLLPQSVFGQLLGIISERESLIWELAELVYNSQYPDTATGTSLDNVAAITGIARMAAVASKVDVQFFGTAGTVVPAGTQFSVDGNPTAQFQTLANVTLVAGLDEVQLLTFSGVPTAGNFRIVFDEEETANIPFSALAAAVKSALEALPNVDTVTVTGSFALGFTITFNGTQVKKRELSTVTITNNTLTNPGVVTVTPSVVTEGSFQASIASEAVLTGPVQAPRKTLIVIDTPVFGLDAAENFIDDAVVGRDLETDAELRLRRARTLQVAGNATVEAIRSRILSLTGVTDVIIFENFTEVPDIAGRPPKSYEVTVAGGDDPDITEAMWLSKPAGIRLVGTNLFFFVDSQGFSQPIRWSRPTEIDIYIDLNISTDTSFTATAADVKNAYEEYGEENLGIGEDVIVYPSLLCVLNSFVGITDVVIKVGIAPAPTLDNNIAIAPNEIGKIFAANVTVTIV